jgi:hypothetical protein
VIAAGTSPVAVFHAAEASGRSPFVTCVGHEDEPTRMRRVNFAYDRSYPGEPVPIRSLESCTASGSSVRRVERTRPHAHPERRPRSRRQQEAT